MTEQTISAGMGYSPFDSDPEALTWARGKVEREIARMRQFEEDARRTGSTDPEQWRKFGNMLDMRFIGGEGGVIAAFDRRSPDYIRMLDASRPAVDGDF